ncbi:MAG: alpha-galactosidase [bacterium]|nr:MAG: alpha-galactosidase [bacterium]
MTKKILFQLFFTIFLVIVMQSCTSKTQKSDIIVALNSDWKFKTGDDMTWASPELDDSGWEEISTENYWENQGFENYNGYAWYRISFDLPQSMLDQAFLKDSVQIVIGRVDDTEQTYLNGQLIGQNGVNISPGKRDAPGKFEGDLEAYQIFRHYKLAVDDPCLNWGGKNTLAIRVHDHFQYGGLNSEHVLHTYGKYLKMVEINDFIDINENQYPTQIKNRVNFSKKLVFTNRYHDDLDGEICVTVFDSETEKKVFRKTSGIELPKGVQTEFSYQFTGPEGVSCTVVYEFVEAQSGKVASCIQELPYILTPPIPEEPRINGAKVYGAHPGSSFLFQVAASGLRPMKFSAENLPEGLRIDQNTGIISGSVQKQGEYLVALSAKNEKGEAKDNLKIVIGEKLALTPPMGWNSWNAFGLNVDEEKIRAAADKFVESGLSQHGWSFINIDDGWEASARNEDGELLSNEKFPNMKALGDYIHSKGLKFGIYSSPGPLTCGGYLGSYTFEQKDVDTWCKWGVDYLKYDWCSYREIAKDNSLAELKKPYLLMRDVLKNADRDIVYSLCQYGMGNVWEWGEAVGGNLWRTTGDIVDTWQSLKTIGFTQDNNAAYAKTGHWNDPDMLIVGWVGWNETIHPTRLSANEQYLHISLWCLLSAPLLLGNDLTKLDDFTLNLLTNDEVLAVNQDPLGKQAIPVYKDDHVQVWSKKLHDGSAAVGLFNLGSEKCIVTANWQDIGLRGKLKVRDLWRQKDLGDFEGKYEASVPPHGVILVSIK